MIYEKERRYIIPFDDVPSPRAEMPEISVDERRGNFQEVETGFPEEVAIREAKRCLSCRRCLGCALCWAECKPEAIDFSLPDQTHEREFDEVVLTTGQENSFEPVGENLGYGRHPEVITDLQFERMLSPTGPTGGMVVSPRDGEIPRRIALIQGSPQGGEEHLLSSAVLGVNEAIVALHRTEGLQVLLISPLSEPFREQFLPKAQEVPGLQLVEGTPVSVERKEDGALHVTYTLEQGQRTEAIDMAVILTKPATPSYITSLSRKLQLPVH